MNIWKGKFDDVIQQINNDNLDILNNNIRKDYNHIVKIFNNFNNFMYCLWTLQGIFELDDIYNDFFEKYNDLGVDNKIKFINRFKSQENFNLAMNIPEFILNYYISPFHKLLLSNLFSIVYKDLFKQDNILTQNDLLILFNGILPNRNINEDDILNYFRNDKDFIKYLQEEDLLNKIN